MTDRLRRVDFGLIYVLQVLTAVSISTVLSLLPAVGRSSGIPDALIVTAQALSAGAWIVVAGYWGRLAQRRGRKFVMLIGCSGIVLGCALTGVAIWIAVLGLMAPMLALAIITIARTTNGAIGLAGGPAGQAFVVERTEPERRTVVLSSLASANAFGTILGPAAAPFMTHIPGLGLAGPILIVAALCLALLPLLAFVLPRDTVASAAPASTGEVAKAESIWRMPAVRGHLVYSTILAITAIGTMQTIGFLVIDTIRLSPDAAQGKVGLAIAAGAASTLFVQLVLTPWLKPSPRALMIAAPLVALAGLMLFAILPDYSLLIAAAIVSSAGFAAGRPGVATAASLALPVSRQAEVAAAILSTASIGVIVGPVLAVALYTVWQPLPFLLMGAMQGLALLIAVRHADARKSKPFGADPM